MIKFGYIKNDSIFGKIDSINKMFWLIGIAVLSYFITEPVLQLILFFCIVLNGLILAKLPPKNFFSAFTIFLIFGFIMFLMQIVFYSGEESLIYFQVGYLKIGREGFRNGINLCLRVFVVGSSALTYIMTTEPRRMIYDMVARAGIPYRFAFAFYAAFRYIPIMEVEAINIRNAHIVRGTLEIEKGLKGRLRILKCLAVPLIVSGLRKAKMSAIAMESRAFGAYPKRTLTYTYTVPFIGYCINISIWIIALSYLIYLIVNGLWQFS
jgi:energy-coupling factor transport system permease protein